MKTILRCTALLAMLAATATGRPAAAAELGTYAGAGCTGVKNVGDFIAWYGAKPKRMLDFFAFDTWDGMVSEAQWATQCWKGTGYDMTFSVPLLANDHVSTLAAAARGDYDSHFHAIGEAIVKAGFGASVIRIGWEFNGGWYAWAAKSDPASWIGAWRHAVTAMRSVPGQSFVFDWSPTWGTQQIDPEKVYPGDEFVDVIGLDVYNATWAAATAQPDARWASFVNDNNGLRWQADFARAHGKRISLPEWGTGTRPDGHGPGDDPVFVLQMAKWIRDQNVLYHNYWNYDAPDYRSRLDHGQFPRSGKAFLDSFPPDIKPGAKPGATP